MLKSNCIWHLGSSVFKMLTRNSILIQNLQFEYYITLYICRSIMIIEKIFSVRLDFDKSSELYTSNIDDTILRKLNHRFKNRCFKSSYIINIDKIIRRSPIMIHTDLFDGSGYTSVCFQAKVIVLAKGEILNGCKIVEIKKNGILAEHEFAVIKLHKLSNNKITQVLDIGNIIPVIIDYVRYLPNSDKISIVGIPYFPRKELNKIYRIKEPLEDQQLKIIEDTLYLIQQEEQKHIELKKKKSYQIFDDIMYPFKVTQKFGMSKLAKVLRFKPVKFTLEEFNNLSGKIAIYPTEEKCSNKTFYTSSSIEVPSENSLVTIDISAYNFIMSILNKYIIYLLGLRGMCETYKTLTDMNQAKLYWKMCRALRE
jgi:hypothetical protein